MEVESAVNILVNLANHANVVSSDYVETQHHLLHSLTNQKTLFIILTNQKSVFNQSQAYLNIDKCSELAEVTVEVEDAIELHRDVPDRQHGAAVVVVTCSIASPVTPATTSMTSPPGSAPATIVKLLGWRLVALTSIIASLVTHGSVARRRD